MVKSGKCGPHRVIVLAKCLGGGLLRQCQLLDELVRTMKRSGGGVGIQLDISKAFDTVPHKAIEHALT
jgi:hypothetical protein